LDYDFSSPTPSCIPPADRQIAVAVINRYGDEVLNVYECPAS
jgi:hypothetical protein